LADQSMTKAPGHPVRQAGLLPASTGGALDDLALAIHDQRYELGPVTAYLRDPQVENIDINGFDQK
jgi:hypothetical protein